MRNLTEVQLNLLEAMTYIDHHALNSIGRKDKILDLNGKETVGQALDIFDDEKLEQMRASSEELFPGGYTPNEMADIIKKLKTDENLKDLEIIKFQSNEKHNLYMGFKLPEDEIHEKGGCIVAYRGTSGNKEWADDAEAMYKIDSPQQVEALGFYYDCTKENGKDKYDYAYVIGHSKGANKAEYVTLVADSNNAPLQWDGEKFQKVDRKKVVGTDTSQHAVYDTSKKNIIKKCIGFNGEGLASNTLRFYEGELNELQKDLRDGNKKMTIYASPYDVVTQLLKHVSYKDRSGIECSVVKYCREHGNNNDNVAGTIERHHSAGILLPKTEQGEFAFEQRFVNADGPVRGMDYIHELTTYLMDYDKNGKLVDTQSEIIPANENARRAAFWTADVLGYEKAAKAVPLLCDMNDARKIMGAVDKYIAKYFNEKPDAADRIDNLFRELNLNEETVLKIFKGQDIRDKIIARGEKHLEANQRQERPLVRQNQNNNPASRQHCKIL